MKFEYTPVFPQQKEHTKYRKLTSNHVQEVRCRGEKYLRVEPEALRLLAREAFSLVNFYFRTSHLENLAAILDDPEASDNDRFVAASLLKNAVISAEGLLPLCQDTGTANIIGYKGEKVLTGADDARYLSRGVFEAYTRLNLRASQNAPLSILEEKNTGNNLPAQVEIFSTGGSEYRFYFMAKGGGSSNKTALYQENKSLLRDEPTLLDFLREKIKAIGVAACPPYRLAVVIGGLSPEMNVKTVKLASAGFLDNLVTRPTGLPHGYRDLEWEKKVLRIARETGLGAQFGGVALAVETRVIRLPRHGGSLPVGIGVSCNADRNLKAKINRSGIFVEELDRNPARFLKKIDALKLEEAPAINLDQPIDSLVEELSRYPVGTRLRLSGTLIVARDMAHLRLKRMLDEGKPLPDYFKNHPVYYAGPARTPKGLPTGSFGPTSAQRMDNYVDEFMKAGASRVMLAKGNRSDKVAEACRKYRGFYLGTIGGAAALVAREHIVSSELVDFADLGMEAIRKIVVRDLPAFIIFDSRGNKLY
ncbi:MAG: FumA C-terminus/TtdB family hydratase beta subunit [Candidatus Saccharicenans sp.]|jgi:fumarate hydratase class I|nr:FumA C-terminus/TtdB family hydratase beta subunit [Candidatus Saccharicenans sp.]MDH7574660.1 FumA C-terminus/TtdB family hydratase beta subunit [Candidatus Saccharicenans sp.]